MAHVTVLLHITKSMEYVQHAPQANIMTLLPKPACNAFPTASHASTPLYAKNASLLTFTTLLPPNANRQTAHQTKTSKTANVTVLKEHTGSKAHVGLAELTNFMILLLWGAINAHRTVHDALTRSCVGNVSHISEWSTINADLTCMIQKPVRHSLANRWSLQILLPVNQPKRGNCHLRNWKRLCSINSTIPKCNQARFSFSKTQRTRVKSESFFLIAVLYLWSNLMWLTHSTIRQSVKRKTYKM